MWMRSTKTKYLLQQENKTNNGRLSLTVPRSDLYHNQYFYLRGFKSDFDAVKSKFGLLIEKIQKTTSK